jgi:CxxC motif-containing protein (DUF1111 family)
MAASLLLMLLGNAAGAAGAGQRGAALFSTTFAPSQGLGPLFNNTSCLGCHNAPSPGGTGPAGLATVLRVGRIEATRFDPMVGAGGPVGRAHSVAEFGDSCGLMPGVPSGANVTSVRNALQLYGAGEIDSIPDAAILALAEGQSGRPNIVNGRVGRFGWKADTPSLRQFVGDAFRNELGLTNPIAPADLVDGCDSGQVDVDESVVDAVTTFIGELPRPPATAGDATVFEATGCGACHVARVAGVPLYSDLLIHDMGRALDDGVTQAEAQGEDWRTTPLWGLHQRARFLHDGRARTVEAAILAHGGDAEAAVQRFRALSATSRSALMAFLASL